MKYSLYAKRIFKWNLKVADDTTLPGSQIHSEKFISGKTLNTIGKKKNAWSSTDWEEYSKLYLKNDELRALKDLVTTQCKLLFKTNHLATETAYQISETLAIIEKGVKNNSKKELFYICFPPSPRQMHSSRICNKHDFKEA